MTQTFNPFAPQGIPQQQPVQGAPAGVPGYGVPPGAYGQPQQAQAPAPQFQPAPAPVTQYAPQGFGVPQAPPGYAPAPAGAVPFQAQDPSLDDREDGPPVGMTSFECTGEVELGGMARNLLVVKLRAIQSQSAQPGTPFAFKRDLTPHRQWGLKYASDEIGKFIAAILGIDTKTVPASQITPLINELVQTASTGRATLGGQPLAGRRGVVNGVQKQLAPSQKHPQGKIVVNGNWQKHP